MNKLINLETYKRMAKNFVTPNIISYVMTSDGRIIEFSRGHFMGKMYWGVSEFDTNVKTTHRGQCFNQYRLAKMYFNTLLGAF